MTLQCLTSVYCYGSLNIQVPSVKKCSSFARFFLLQNWARLKNGQHCRWSWLMRWTRITLLPSGSPFWYPGPHGDLFQILGPQKVRIFSRSPFSPFQAEECAKSQSSHYLLNVDNLNTCDDKTSFNLYTCTPNEATLCEGVFLLFISRN